MSCVRPLLSATRRTSWQNSSVFFSHPSKIISGILPLSTVPAPLTKSSRDSLSFPFENSINVFDSLVSEVLKTHINVKVQQPSFDYLRNQCSGSLKPPIVLLFGLEDSSHHNISKYSEIYREAGCTTVQYILPVEYIFDYTEKVPELMKSFLLKLEDEEELQHRPVYIHCHSETEDYEFYDLKSSSRAKQK